MQNCFKDTIPPEKKNDSRLTDHREAWADVAKGVAILLMVYGHTCIDSFTKFFTFFHMPLFMMVSGYFFSTKTDYRTFCKKKIKGLAIPYMIYFSIGFITNWIYEMIFYANHPLIPRWIGSITEIVLPLYDTGKIPGLWFLIALLFIFLFWGGIARLCNIYIFCVLVFAGSIGAYLLREYVILPFFLSPALVLSVFFLFGYLLKKCSYSPEKIHSGWNVLIFLISVFILIYACYHDPCIDYKSMDLSISYIHLLFLGITGSMMVFSFSAFLPCPVLSSFLQYAGRSTLWILGIHSPFLRYSLAFWPKVEEVFPIFRSVVFLRNLTVYFITLSLIFISLSVLKKILTKMKKEHILLYFGIRN